MRKTQNPNSEITRRASSSAVITLEMMHSNQLPRQLLWFTKEFNELVARRIIERQFFFTLLYPLRPSFVSLSFVQYHLVDISVLGTRHALQLHRTCIVSSRFSLTDLPICRDSTRKGPTLPGEQQAARRLFSPKLRPRVEHLPSRVRHWGLGAGASQPATLIPSVAAIPRAIERGWPRGKEGWIHRRTNAASNEPFEWRR